MNCIIFNNPYKQHTYIHTDRRTDISVNRVASLLKKNILMLLILGYLRVKVKENCRKISTKKHVSGYLKPKK